MRIILNLCLTLAVLQLAACVSVPVQQTETNDAVPSLNSGYVVGSFTTNKGTGFGFGFVNTGTGDDYVMPFGEDTSLPSARNKQLGLIQLPPGEYKIAYWVTYATLTKVRILKKDITNSIISEPFRVAPGSVTYIGSFSASTEHIHGYNSTQTIWKIRSERISQQDANDAFDRNYPKFAELPFTCILCIR